MNSNSTTNSVKTDSGRCSDIYTDEIKKQINTLKRFREAWLRFPGDWATSLFQYADPDFYFFRFTVDRQEKSTEPFLIRVILRIMERYGIVFEIPADTFAFVITEAGRKKGYRFEDFYMGQDIANILQQSNVDDAFILYAYKSGRPDEWIARDNAHYEADGVNLRAESLETFFKHYFGETEYNDFLKAIDQYTKDAREITGYKSIKFFSKMNLATQKAIEEKTLTDWQYKTYEYQIIDRQDPRVSDFLYFSPNLFPASELDKMVENYVQNGLYKAMVGSEEFAESFRTSEWLYYSLKDLKHFDYTAVISGYLKSVEQLLYKIVMLNVDNNCKIAMSGARDVGREAVRNRVRTYKWDYGSWTIVPANDRTVKFKYIDLTQAQVQYMDSSIGTFEYFLKNNPHIFVFPGRAKTIADMVSCFRTECRNDFFHTHNLSDWDVVEIVRANATYLYFVLLGGCVIPSSKSSSLGMLSDDSFDELCKRIREFQHYNGEFIFEYADGRKLNLIYDFMNNTIEFNDSGEEHYEHLLFYSVERFGLEAYEKLDEGIREEQIVYLTRNDLPTRILGLYRDGRIEEIPI